MFRMHSIGSVRPRLSAAFNPQLRPQQPQQPQQPQLELKPEEEPIKELEEEVVVIKELEEEVVVIKELEEEVVINELLEEEVIIKELEEAEQEPQPTYIEPDVTVSAPNKPKNKKKQQKRR